MAPRSARLRSMSAARSPAACRIFCSTSARLASAVRHRKIVNASKRGAMTASAKAVINPRSERAFFMGAKTALVFPSRSARQPRERRDPPNHIINHGASRRLLVLLCGESLPSQYRPEHVQANGSIMATPLSDASRQILVAGTSKGTCTQLSLGIGHLKGARVLLPPPLFGSGGNKRKNSIYLHQSTWARRPTPVMSAPLFLLKPVPGGLPPLPPVICDCATLSLRAV